MTIQARLAALAASWTARLIALAVLLGLAVWFWASWSSGQTAKTEAKLSANQVEAATASGKDAVNTVGAVGQTEDKIDLTTRENRDEIYSAEGADAPVNPAVGDAGLRGLCRRAAYRDHPDCLQHTSAR